MRSLPTKALALVATAACGGGTDPAPGDWNIDELQLGGLVYSLPIELTDSIHTESLSLDEDGTAEWVRLYTDTTGYGNDQASTYTLEATRVRKGEWILKNENMNISLTCEAEPGAMHCEGSVGESALRMELTEADG